MKGTDSPALADYPGCGLSPLTHAVCGLADICRGAIGKRNEYPGDMGKSPPRTARESKTKDSRQRYLQGSPSHKPPLHNLVTGITQFILENRQQVKSGSKLG